MVARAKPLVLSFTGLTMCAPAGLSAQPMMTRPSVLIGWTSWFSKLLHMHASMRSAKHVH